MIAIKSHCYKYDNLAACHQPQWPCAAIRPWLFLTPSIIVHFAYALGYVCSGLTLTFSYVFEQCAFYRTIFTICVTVLSRNAGASVTAIIAMEANRSLICSAVMNILSSANLIIAIIEFRKTTHHLVTLDSTSDHHNYRYWGTVCFVT